MGCVFPNKLMDESNTCKMLPFCKQKYKVENLEMGKQASDEGHLQRSQIRQMMTETSKQGAEGHR